MYAIVTRSSDHMSNRRPQGTQQASTFTREYTPVADPSFSVSGAHVLLQGISLGHRLPSLKVTLLVLALRTDGGGDNDVDGHRSDEGALNENVVWCVFLTARCLDCRV